MKRILWLVQFFALGGAVWCGLDAIALINKPLAYCVSFALIYVAIGFLRGISNK